MFLIVPKREDWSLLYMGQWSKKCVVDSTSAPHLHNGFCDTWKLWWDDWDQDGVLLETWFLADYDIQIHF